MFSSTADFTLSSPLSKTNIIVTSIDATAYYQKTEQLGEIHYLDPFEVPPGISQTPRFPVDLNLGGVAYSAVKGALGGSLGISAVAEVGIQVDHYRDSILYKGDSIAAKIRV